MIDTDPLDKYVNPSRPPTVTVDVAAEMLGVSRGTAYQQIKAGRFPVPVLHIGRRIVVPTAPLEHLLATGRLPGEAA